MNTLPIMFGKLCLKMSAYFFEKDKEKIEYVDVEIDYESENLYRFQLINQVELIDTKLKSQHLTDVKGEMYLDLSKEKIIFEGFYYEEGKLKGPFWLEVDPFSESSEIISRCNPPSLECPPYPASVGTLSINLTPSAPALDSASNNYIPQNGVTIEVKQRESSSNLENGKPKETIYLLTTLHQNNRITGVDTAEKGKNHFPDFSGDVGTIRNRAYVDGYLKLNGKPISSFYLEMGI
ncbi:MAG TPA: hypothetical protein VIO64_00500 [Pseudobacteroides sp.]|uniref:hypothetical protein n=1 Tax=Pseudobacteroides sp. TaxID=1968840 RepID=UPI002F929964